MTIEISEKEIEAIAFAHSNLQLKQMFNNRLTGKPKQHLMQYTKVLGLLLDRIEKQEKENKNTNTNSTN